jgi:hypothetical protein
LRLVLSSGAVEFFANGLSFFEFTRELLGKLIMSIDLKLSLRGFGVLSYAPQLSVCLIVIGGNMLANPLASLNYRVLYRTDIADRDSTGNLPVVGAHLANHVHQVPDAAKR